MYCSQCMQFIWEFDRIHEGTESKTIIEFWENLIPTIYHLAQNETSAAIVNMIEGVEDFSEGTCT